METTRNSGFQINYFPVASTPDNGTSVVPSIKGKAVQKALTVYSAIVAKDPLQVLEYPIDFLGDVSYRIGDGFYKASSIPRYIPSAAVGGFMLMSPIIGSAIYTATDNYTKDPDIKSMVLPDKPISIARGYERPITVEPSGPIEPDYSETELEVPPGIDVAEDRSIMTPQIMAPVAGSQVVVQSLDFNTDITKLVNYEDGGCHVLPSGVDLCYGKTPLITIDNAYDFLSKRWHKAEYLQDIQNELGVSWKVLAVKMMIESKMGKLAEEGKCGAGKYCGDFQLGPEESARYCPPGTNAKDPKYAPFCAVNLNKSYHAKVGLDFNNTNSLTMWKLHNQGPGGYEDFINAKMDLPMDNKNRFIRNVCNNIPSKVRGDMCYHPPVVNKRGRTIYKNGKPLLQKVWLLGSGYTVKDLAVTYEVAWGSELQRLDDLVTDFVNKNPEAKAYLDKVNQA